MELKAFLNSSYESTKFETFISENFHGFSVRDNNYTDDYLSESEKCHIQDYRYLGQVELDDGKEVGFFEFRSTSPNIENKRVGYNATLKKLAKDHVLDGAFASFFYPDGKDEDVWRLSFVGIDYDRGKVNITNLKRYTYVLGKHVAIQTPLEQLKDFKYPTIEKIEKAFSVEKVSKEFFEKYKRLYNELSDYLQSQMIYFNNEKNLNLFTKKLLGRVVFLYFIQKKGWFGSKEEWGTGNKKFLSDLFENKQSYNDFYFDILQPIFFKALNEKRDNDYFAPLDCKMPFLNGGLFSEDEFDKKDIMIDNAIFESIFTTFNQYNFTIIEDNPNDSEIAIDPEMLGRVFESLLEDRKEKGAFYTPREIVHYMSKKSIENYLETQIKEHSYSFSVEEFLQHSALSDDDVLEFYKNHPVKFVKINNYFEALHPYKNLIIDFFIVAKLRGLWLDSSGNRVKNERGHQEVSSDIWYKVLKRDYKIIAINFGSNKEMKSKNTTYKYPTILKYIEIQDKYFALAFIPNVFENLELATIFPIRLKEIRRKIKKIGKNLDEISEENFVFNSEVFSKIKELQEDCRPLHTEPLSLSQVEELPRQAVIQKGLSTFYNSFNVKSITNADLSALLESRNYYNKFINVLLSNSNTPQDELKKIMIIVLKKIKVLDPAIGSGAFPMGVLHEIVDARVHLGDKTPLAKMKREIIENSIYGIDVEPSAVEIAKLRFWLSIVVDEERPTPLPNLFYKIMVGNSLLETINGFDPLDKKKQNSKTKKELKFLEDRFHKYFNTHDKNEKNAIKREIERNINSILSTSIKNFNTQKTFGDKTPKEQKEFEQNFETYSSLKRIISDYHKSGYTQELFFYEIYFREVMQNGGFDLVIGNPPYLRVQGIEKQLSEQYKKLFNSATGSYDLYILFVEKALNLLSDSGIVNYIMPHKWINASFGKGVREITKNKVSKFISFGAYQVFNASTYTSLVWFQNNKSNNHLDYVELDKDLNTNRELEQYLFDLEDNSYTNIKNNDLTSANWIFTNKETYEILEKLKQQPLRVQDIFEKIFTGLQTSQDSVYFLFDCIDMDNFIEGFSKELNKRVVIEIELVKPLLKGDDIHRYEEITTDKVVIFPYYIENEDAKDKAVLYTEDELNIKFPNGYKYLKECESVLKGREKGRFNIDGEWFQYGRKQGILSAHKEKLIQPDISLGGNFSYDKNGEFFQTATLYGYKKYDFIKESYKFYMAILNSKLLWWYLTQTGTTLANGYFRFKTDYLNPFPIPKIENIEDTRPFEILVDYIMYLKTDIEQIDNYVENSHLVKLFEEIIDALVYELYFRDEFKEKNIEFIKYAKEYFKSIEKLDDEAKVIQNSYQLLREKDNKIRNNLQLMPIRVPLVVPIMQSI